MEKHREIERKFLVTQSALVEAGIYDRIAKMPYMDIIQGYIPSDGSQWVRLRQTLYTLHNRTVIGEEYTWTIKGSGSVDRPERETPIWKQQFHVMWPVFEALSLHKHRYEMESRGAKVLHLDFYKNGESGLITAEVEFDTPEQCEAYAPENWFGFEVSHEKEWTNYAMAVKRAERIRNRQQ